MSRHKPHGKSHNRHSNGSGNSGHSHQRLTSEQLIHGLESFGATSEDRAIDKNDLQKAFKGALNFREVLDGLREDGIVDISHRRVFLTGAFRENRMDVAKPSRSSRSDRPAREVPDTLVGEVKTTDQGLAIFPVNRHEHSQRYFLIPQEALEGIAVGDIVSAKVLPADARGFHNAVVEEHVGKKDSPNIISLIAMKEAGLTPEFSPEVLAEVEGATVPELGKRRDLRNIPLITIDPKTARDFDDAVFAEPITQGPNAGGHRIVVAIADVAHYVKAGSKLDEEALSRGNSTYFPDRVVPMLPEALSNDLCSLRPHEDRACMAVDMTIDAKGKLVSAEVMRGLMNSKARLTYEQAEAAIQHREFDEVTGPVADRLDTLQSAYKVLREARDKRGALDIEKAEREIVIKDGKIESIAHREHLDSHQLIEEMMVLANVAVAKALREKGAPVMSRLHEPPLESAVNGLRNALEGYGLTLSKKEVLGPKDFNEVLQQAKTRAESVNGPESDNTAFLDTVTTMVMRAQSRARYDATVNGHFGLGLPEYAHFTSPIRRYSDLVIHRAIISAFGFGPDGLTPADKERMPEVAEHISMRERISDMAEQDATERYVAAYLEDFKGKELDGVVSKVMPSGLIVNIGDTGQKGFIPISKLLPKGHFEFDESQQALIRRNGGAVYRLGAKLPVEVLDTDPITGTITLKPANDEGAQVPGFEIDNPGRGGRSQEVHRDEKQATRAHFPQFFDGPSPNGP